MVILSPKQRKEALNSLLSGFIQDFLITEKDSKGIGQELATQTNQQFYHHADHVADLKAKGIFPEFVDFGNGIAVYNIKSSEWKLGHGMSDNEYTMVIRFYDWNKFFDDPQLNLVQRVNQLTKGNLGIMCSCPSFQYHYGYQTNIKKSEFYDSEHRNYFHTLPAPVKNPANVGIGCKHLDMLLNRRTYLSEVLPDVYNAIKNKLPSQSKDKQALTRTPGIPSAPAPSNAPTGVSPSAPNSKRNKPMTQGQRVQTVAGQRNPTPHTPNVGRMKYLDVEPKIKESIEKEFNKKLLLIESPLAKGIPEGFSLLSEDQNIIEEESMWTPVKQCRYIDESFIIAEGMQNATKAITSYITKITLFQLNQLAQGKIQQIEPLEIDISKIDPNLNVLKKQIYSKNINPFLLDIKIELIASNDRHNESYEIANARYEGDTNSISLKLFKKSSQNIIDFIKATNIGAAIEHELRHWYQFNFWKDNKKEIDEFFKSPEFNHINHDLLSSNEIDSYIRQWLYSIRKLKLSESSIDYHWVIYLTEVYKLLLKKLSNMKNIGVENIPPLALKIINLYYIPFAYNHLMTIHPIIAKHIKTKEYNMEIYSQYKDEIFEYELNIGKGLNNLRDHRNEKK